jgi:hypothetical protein
MNHSAMADTLAQRRLQIGRAPMLFEQIAEGFISQFLKVHHTVVNQEINRLPRRAIELDVLSGHQADRLNDPSGAGRRGRLDLSSPRFSIC